MSNNGKKKSFIHDLSRIFTVSKFFVSAHVSFARANEIEAMFKKSRVNVKFDAIS